MNNDKSKNIIITLLIVIIIILGALVALFATNTISFNTNTTDKDNSQEQTTIKIDNNLDYVYDAKYTYNNKYTEFKRASYNNEDNTQKISRYGIEVEYTNGMQYLSNLKVPYININTDTATKANKELEKLYLEYAKNFDSCAESAMEQPESPQSNSCSQILTYRTYTHDNVLSIVVIDSVQSTAAWILNYNIYNFDLTTGNLLNYSDLLSKLGYDKEETLSKTKNILKNKIDELYSDRVGDMSKACRETLPNALEYEEVSCYDKANELLESEINTNNVLAFVDNDGNLNILAVAYYDGIETGTENKYLLTITK